MIETAQRTQHEYPKEARPAHFLGAGSGSFRYVEKTNPAMSALQFLTYGVYEMSGSVQTGWLAHPGEETLLFAWKGTLEVSMEGESPVMEEYDVLYIPEGERYRLRQSGGESRAVVCRAPASKKHPAHLARWKAVSGDETRIRRLKGKDVYLMFDVAEPAEKLVAGYTIFQPHQRSYPPHNHTDQEEIYIFTRGTGAMEVYADEESKSFVRSVSEGDAVTIPVLNYHPVFSQEEPLHFIWCIAGERYWVGDKNRDFMKGTGGCLTT